MKNNKGFSLIEVLTVVIILGILAALSTPFLRGYVRDARNDRAKSVLFLIAQGVKNFKNDFSYLTVSNTGPLARQNLGTSINTDSCSTALESVTNNSVGYDFLIKCSYLQNLNYTNYGYNFYIGGGINNACTSMTNSALAYMIGNDGGDYCSNYCAFIDQNNNLHEVKGTCTE